VQIQKLTSSIPHKAPKGGHVFVDEGHDWSIEETHVFIAKFRNNVKERKVHAYFEVVVIHARKSLA
jgi:hypothetical protein